MSGPISRAEMLIRKAVTEVFDAFVQPRTLEKFWLKSASAPLAKDAIVEWEFLVAGARETVTVNEFFDNRRIGFTWSDGVVVKLEFAAHDNSTRVAVTADGFSGKNAIDKAIGATEGFTIVLCDLKNLLEIGRSGNMVRDKAALISAAKREA